MELQSEKGACELAVVQGFWRLLSNARLVKGQNNLLELQQSLSRGKYM